MTNGTGGPNLYAIDICSEIRTIFKVLTKRTGIHIKQQFLANLFGMATVNIHLSVTGFPLLWGMCLCVLNGSGKT